MLDLNNDCPVLFLLSSWVYRCETPALDLYAIFDCCEILKGNFSEGAVLRMKNTNRGECTKISCNPFYFRCLWV
jgi:hypothetical protein